MNDAIVISATVQQHWLRPWPTGRDSCGQHPNGLVHVPRILELRQNDTDAWVMAPRYGVGRLADTGRNG